ncbi:MAG: mannose-1-phosphate guanylyltransferase [Gemmatimonadetes bacterium]|uniref:Mannose-1-phosphate guanylyltransferase n=1 Tax=Candidatus Kutchimonas denitrificans TaxID=3056748 RepID=A0AAE4ZAD2_9BACT|nr:mannose-1-phosphate guanylyltransferase [Gemmatimonadota bacterium]NIR76234.1 mannose-1-phosphate guanylyltransferase [Candidatus Kutchimonas denitrificans]NIS00674.1 mannose-1-phosphate guanylyltransferase [Gemmatimonadota bacterium]NIT66819.1 mannose-1-phosphate guanylyltransferase [Gemmatimonadota bacterium]NIV23418.1 NTP transferase domain-containing protein [Gemmatimonadota bacterium]
MNDGTGFERWVVILAGGIGSRFWPASTPRRPKQFLALGGARPLIVDTVDRAERLAPAGRVLIVAGAALQPHIERHLPEFPSECLLLEPQARGTAAALAWAATVIRDRADDPERAVMVSLHSDHVIRPVDRFVDTLGRAVDAAGRLDRLLAIGVTPDRPETGYGYMEVGGPLDEGVLEIRRFVEKPDRETAEGYIERGDFLWNSGMFVWRPTFLLAQLAAHAPELAGELGRLDRGDIEGFFAAIPNLTIDHGLMERSPHIATVKADFAWDDVGAWAALLRVFPRDDDGNLLIGHGQAVDSRNNLIWAEDGPVVTFDCDDLLVVRAFGITLVAPLERSADLKRLLAELPEKLREGEI